MILAVGCDVLRCCRKDATATQGGNGPMIVDAVLALHLRDGDGAALVNERELRASGQVWIEILKGDAAPLVLDAPLGVVYGPKKFVAVAQLVGNPAAGAIFRNAVVRA
ncbi:hypothetical protein [Kocuria kalidii]|uniref:hypothetical protein n=1 Tax=Kocuria kalidii TaxID=3376283 RepID=UPI0037BF38A4